MNTYSGVYSGDTKYADYFKIANIEDTQWVAGIDVNQTNETAAEYINRVLTKNAMTVEKDTYGNSSYGTHYLLQTTGYKYYVDAKGHHFEHIDFNASAANAPTLTYGSKDSTIISFSVGKVGAYAMTNSLYDESTGQPNVDSSVLDDISGATITIGGENVFGADVSEEDKEAAKEYKNWYTFTVSPNNIESSTSASSFEKTVYNTWNDLFNYTTTAEMTVWGESGVKLSPGNFVNIIVYGNGRKHYSTGCYYITSMEDNISSDGYTQTCKMIKNPSSILATEINKNISGVKVLVDGNGKLNITWTDTTYYSNGVEVDSLTPANSLEIQYYRDLLYSNGWQDNYPAQQQAIQRLKSQEYAAISEAKKNLLKNDMNWTDPDSSGGRRW